MSIDESRYTNRNQLSQSFGGPNDSEYLNPVKLIQIFFTIWKSSNYSTWQRFSRFSYGLLHSLYVTEMYNEFLLYCKILNSIYRRVIDGIDYCHLKKSRVLQSGAVKRIFICISSVLLRRHQLYHISTYFHKIKVHEISLDWLRLILLLYYDLNNWEG